MVIEPYLTIANMVILTTFSQQNGHIFGAHVGDFYGQEWGTRKQLIHDGRLVGK